MSFPVAIQLYSVRDEMEKDFFGTIQKIRDMGYDGVEFAGLFGKSAELVRDGLSDIGIIPVSAHVPYYDMLENPDGVMADYALIGCRYIAVPYLTPELRPGTDGFSGTIDGIKKIGEAALRHGLTLLYHNHDFEFVKLGEEYALDVLYSSVSPELLKTEIDTCWVNVAGVEPSAYIEKYSGRSPVVHLKDFVMNGKGTGQKYKLIGIDDDKGGDADDEEDFAFRPVGSGVQDFKAILASAEKAGTEWVVVEQDSPSMGKTTLESAEMSINYLKSIQ